MGLKNRGPRLEKTILIISVRQIFGFIPCLDGCFRVKKRKRDF